MAEFSRRIENTVASSVTGGPRLAYGGAAKISPVTRQRFLDTFYTAACAHGAPAHEAFERVLAVELAVFKRVKTQTTYVGAMGGEIRAYLKHLQQQQVPAAALPEQPSRPLSELYFKALSHLLPCPCKLKEHAYPPYSLGKDNMDPRDKPSHYLAHLSANAAANAAARRGRKDDCAVIGGALDTNKRMKGCDAAAKDDPGQDTGGDAALVQKQTPGQLKECRHCSKLFESFFSGEDCWYHYGRKRYGKQGGRRYTCCNGGATSLGCTHLPTHVWAGRPLQLSDFTTIHPSRDNREDREEDLLKGEIYAIDCEMCYTENGMELIRATFVDFDGNVKLDRYVQPASWILDFNTRFSGIAAREFEAQPRVSMAELHAEIGAFVRASTILVGHSLESDLKALRLIHARCIDTSILYPHPSGPPFRRALRVLAKEFLDRSIQLEVQVGHDSFEDALAALDLVKLYIETHTPDAILSSAAPKSLCQTCCPADFAGLV